MFKYRLFEARSFWSLSHTSDWKIPFVVIFWRISKLDRIKFSNRKWDGLCFFFSFRSVVSKFVCSGRSKCNGDWDVWRPSWREYGEGRDGWLGNLILWQEKSFLVFLYNWRSFYEWNKLLKELWSSCFFYNFTMSYRAIDKKDESGCESHYEHTDKTHYYKRKFFVVFFEFIMILWTVYIIYFCCISTNSINQTGKKVIVWGQFFILPGS